MQATIPCSDDFRHPEGTVYRCRMLPELYPSLPEATYPTRSPFRCFHCRLPFDSVPLFIIRSVMPHGSSGRLTMEIAGNYCCFACRTAALDNSRDVQRETHRMNNFLVDRLLFPHVQFDYTLAMPAHFTLQPFGGNVTEAEWSELRRRTQVLRADFGGVSRIKVVNAVRGVRESYYGQQEGGIGEEKIMERLVAQEPPSEFKPPAPTSGQQLPPLIYRDKLLTEWPREASSPSSTSTPFLCWWCARPVTGYPFLYPAHRDALGTITLDGNFCSAGCMMSFLILEDSTRSIPHLSHERIGMAVSLAVNTMKVPYRCRMVTAPHWQELDVFGGDLDRQEFDIQCTIEDLLTTLEHPPFATARMPPNYTRPGVVCDLARLGESSFEMQRVVITEATAPQRRPLFDLLLREQQAAAAGK